jgi:hypothetical protein
MNRLSKKAVAMLALVAFFLLVAATPFAVQAAQGDKPGPAFGHHQFDPDKAADRLAETFGLSKTTILDEYNKGVKFRDIGRAAFLAKASDKPFGEVLALKTADNKWRDVAQTLGVTKEQVKATRQGLTADRMSAKLGFDRQATLGLLEQGYRPRDVAVAGMLAQDTGKSSQEILDMKKINNNWRDVAQSLGVSQDTLKQDTQKLRQAFGHQGKRFGHHSF